MIISETIIEKKKKYELTECADRFIELEKMQQNDMDYLNSTLSIDLLIQKVLNTDTYVVEGDEGITYYYDNPINCKTYIKNEPIKIKEIYTSSIDYYTNNIDNLAGKNSTKFKQYELKLNMDNLQERLYINTFNDIYYLNLKIPKTISIFKYTTNTYTIYGALIAHLKRFNIHITCTMTIFKYFHHFFMHYLTTSDVIYEDLDRLIDHYEFIIKKKHNICINTIWTAIMYKICRLLGIEEKTELNALELKILKKRPDIISSFYSICEHNINSSDLILKGNFYVCSHGLNIKCIHYEKDNIVEDYGETIISGKITCKICGAELLKNTEYNSIKISKISNFEYDFELRKFLYNKCFYQMNLYVEFLIIVSEEYKYNIANNILNCIFGSLISHYDKLDKIKGYSTETIYYMKEITSILYIFAGIYKLIIINQNIMRFKGLNIIVQKDVALVNIKYVIDKLNILLKYNIEKIKEFRGINISNAFHGVLEELNDKKVDSPKEYIKYNIKYSCLYKYFENIYDMQDYPKINISENNFVDTMIYKSLSLKPEVGSPYQGILVFNEEYVSWQKYLKKINIECMELIRKQNINLRTYTAGYIEQKKIEDKNYLSILYGNQHRHCWASGYTNMGNEYLIDSVPLDEYIDIYKCEICGEKSNKLGPSEYKIYIINMAKHKYYRYYCPVSKFQHDGYPCKLCKYDTHEFIKNYELPTKYIKPIIVVEKVHYYEILDKVVIQEPKIVSNINKQHYINFWKNLYCNEDITFKELLMGKSGNNKVAVSKILSQLMYLNILLANVINLNDSNIKKYEHYINDTGNYEKIIAKIRDIIFKPVIYEFEYIKYKFIEIFNMLPQNAAKSYFLELFKQVEISSQNNEKMRAEAYIGYKNKYINDNTGEEKAEQDGNGFNYDGFDYDGHNE